MRRLCIQRAIISPLNCFRCKPRLSKASQQLSGCCVHVHMSGFWLCVCVCVSCKRRDRSGSHAQLWQELMRHALIIWLQRARLCQRMRGGVGARTSAQMRKWTLWCLHHITLKVSSNDTGGGVQAPTHCHPLNNNPGMVWRKFLINAN